MLFNTHQPDYSDTHASICLLALNLSHQFTLLTNWPKIDYDVHIIKHNTTAPHAMTSLLTDILGYQFQKCSPTIASSSYRRQHARLNTLLIFQHIPPLDTFFDKLLTQLCFLLRQLTDICTQFSLFSMSDDDCCGDRFTSLVETTTHVILLLGQSTLTHPIILSYHHCNYYHIYAHTYTNTQNTNM